MDTSPSIYLRKAHKLIIILTCILTSELKYFLLNTYKKVLNTNVYLTQ